MICVPNTIHPVTTLERTKFKVLVDPSRTSTPTIGSRQQFDRLRVERVHRMGVVIRNEGEECGCVLVRDTFGMEFKRPGNAGPMFGDELIVCVRFNTPGRPRPCCTATIFLKPINGSK